MEGPGDIGGYWGYHIFKNFMVILRVAGWDVANVGGLNGCFCADDCRCQVQLKTWAGYI